MSCWLDLLNVRFSFVTFSNFELYSAWCFRIWSSILFWSWRSDSISPCKAALTSTSDLFSSTVFSSNEMASFRCRTTISTRDLVSSWNDAKAVSILRFLAFSSSKSDSNPFKLSVRSRTSATRLCNEALASCESRIRSIRSLWREESSRSYSCSFAG